MGILLKRTVKKEVEETVKLDKPTFYQVKYGGYMGIYSEDKVKSVTLSGNFACIMQGSYEIQTYCNPIFENEISEECFNEILAKAMFMISGVEVCPTLVLQD